MTFKVVSFTVYGEPDESKFLTKLETLAKKIDRGIPNKSFTKGNAIRVYTDLGNGGRLRECYPMIPEAAKIEFWASKFEVKGFLVLDIVRSSIKPRVKKRTRRTGSWYCVYKLTHIHSGKSYIGQSINPTKRQEAHFKALMDGNHWCRTLQKLWNSELEPETAFSFEVIREDLASRREAALAEGECWINLPEGLRLNNDPLAMFRNSGDTE
jgi:hypothetical protein